MSRPVPHGVFDPGPCPEPVREMSASEADKTETPAESFREKALRRAKEIEAIQSAEPVVIGIDPAVGPDGTAAFQWPQPIYVASPGYREFQEAINRHMARFVEQMSAAKPKPRRVREEPTLTTARLEAPDCSRISTLILQFGETGGVAVKLQRRMTAREVANELHRAAHRIETGLCK